MKGHVLAMVAVLGLGGFWWYDRDPSPPPPGVGAAETPLQEMVTGDADEWPVAGTYRATALASYRVHARVLGVKHYGYDRCAPIAPVDLVLGWGRMSDSSVYGRLDIAQRGRFYLYRWGREGPPIPAGEIIDHSANTHIIPSDAQVAHDLDAVRLHDLVWMEGSLVEVRGPDGFHWRSSLTREDTGDGACELFRVTRLIVEPPPAHQEAPPGS